MTKQQIIQQKIVPHEALTFDDILLLPNYTEIKRQDVDLSITLATGISLRLPVISSPMDTVTETDMAIAMAKAGGMGIIHRNMPPDRQAGQVTLVKRAVVADPKTSAVSQDGRFLVGAAVGVGNDFEERVLSLVDAGADVLVVDSAHGYSKFIIEAVSGIKKKYPKQIVMAGNIATFDGGKALIAAGADILRVGMGPGSICTTRIVTGMGVPQISAVAAVVRSTDGSKATVVADGGIRQVGDMAKALAFGAQAVMLGSMLARFSESPGDTVEVEGRKYKTYRGMGSVGAMKKGGAERYGQGRTSDEKKLIAEGVEGLVEFQGNVSDFLYQVDGSLRSSFYYLGSRTLSDFFEKSRAIKISNAGLYESHPHSVHIEKSGANYQVDGRDK